MSQNPAVNNKPQQVNQNSNSKGSNPGQSTKGFNQQSNSESKFRDHGKRKKWNKHSQKPNGGNTGKPSNKQQQRGGKPQKNDGKKPYAAKPPKKPYVRRGPVYEYISACCGVKALKPRAAQKVTVVDPETKKPKTEVKGLGHWHCTQCKKHCKVTRTKPEPKPEAVPEKGTTVPNPSTPEVTNAQSTVPVQP